MRQDTFPVKPYQAKNPLMFPHLLHGPNVRQDGDNRIAPCPKCGMDMVIRPTDGALYHQFCRCNLEAPKVKPVVVKPVAAPTKSPTVTLDDVPRTEVEWWWDGWLPRRKLCALVGDPGLGKGFLSLDIAARITTGTNFYGEDEKKHDAANVLILTAEDDLGDTIRPRLEAAGADLKRVSAFRPSDLPNLQQTDVLKKAIVDHNAKLVIVDTLAAFLPRNIDAFKDQHIRVVTTALFKLMAETDTTFLLICHLNKASQMSALQRTAGSMGVIGACRSACILLPDPNDEDKRVLCSVKNNVASAPTSIRLHIGGDAPKVQYDGFSDYTADQAIGLIQRKLINPQDSKQEEAKKLLRDYLKDGRKPSDDMVKMVIAKGISRRTMEAAVKELGIRPVKDGATWYRQLPHV